MRTLSTSLDAAQKELEYEEIYKIVLTKSGETTRTYDKDRIIRIENHTEEAYDQKVKVVVDNSDGALTDLDLKGYQAVISYGFITSEEEYSPTAPMYVISQENTSQEDLLTTIFECVGKINLIGEDRARTNYLPEDDDTKTVKDIINDMFDGTMPAFDACPTYTVTWGTEDSLIDSFQPKDTFRIYKNGSRLAALRRLLDYTKCVARFEDDGEIHIYQPTVTGTTYDEEFQLDEDGDGEHSFFSKAHRKRLVIPNRIYVDSQPDDGDSYSGNAIDSASYNALGYYVNQYEEARVTGNAQAGNIAEAMLSKYQLHAEAGAAKVPLNVGSEVYDYVKITDKRLSDSRTGNIGKIVRNVVYDIRKQKLTRFEMVLHFGGWLSIRQQVNNWELHPSGFGSAGQYFNRLTVKDLYVENIVADNILLYTMDDITNGDSYGKVLITEISAGHIKLVDATVVDATFTMDKMNDGSTYGLIKITDLSAGHIKLTSNVVVDGEWYDESGVEIDATHGINLYGAANNLTTRATKAGTIQCYVGSDGYIYAGAGTVILNSSGLTIKGEKIFLQHTDATSLVTFATTASLLQMKSSSGVGIQIICQGEGTLNLDGGGAVSITAGVGDDLDLYAGADIMVDATDGFSLRAGGTAPSAVGTGDINIDGDDLIYIRAGLGEAGNLTLTAGVENSYLGNIYLRAYDNGGGYSGIDMSGSGDIEIDPEGADVIPGSSGVTDFGTETVYWDDIECVTLDDAHSPAPTISDPLAALRAMRETKRTLTVEDVLKEHLGKRLRRKVEEAGGELTIAWKDKDSFPEEILHRPRPEAFEKAKKFNAKKRKQFKERGHTPPQFRDVSPVTSTDVFAEIWLIIRANQRLADEVDLLRDRIAVLEAG
jgi:hypothetical protein